MILYKITCAPTGLIYIGITALPGDRRWKQHWWNSRRTPRSASALYADMRKYGPENWTWEIISHYESHAELLLAERSLIASLDAKNPAVGYNRTSGGQGTLGLRFKKTPEQIEKSARHHRGKKRAPEHVERLRVQLIKARSVPRPSRINTRRDDAIMAHYFSSPSLAVTGIAFNIKAAAVCAALKRCRNHAATMMAATSPLYADFLPPARIHPDHLERAS